MIFLDDKDEEGEDKMSRSPFVRGEVWLKNETLWLLLTFIVEASGFIDTSVVPIDFLLLSVSLSLLNSTAFLVFVSL